MKYLKMFGLAAVAAAALMALAGAGTASATVLCHSTSTPCAEKWGLGTTLEFTVRPGTSGVWTETGGATVATCPEGEIKGNVARVGSETSTVELSVERFVWKSCIHTETLENGILEIHGIAGTDNGTVTASGFKFTTVVNGIDCVYGFPTATTLGTLTPNAEGHAVLDINTTMVKREGSIICPPSLRWTEEFTQTQPSGAALYVEPS
ncbi:MAG: hypothetical protein ACTHNP_13635 [Solirubrobacterales bacterium]